MPRKVERKLEEQAEKKGYTGERKDRYVYGTMNKLHMLHKNYKGKRKK